MLKYHQVLGTHRICPFMKMEDWKLKRENRIAPSTQHTAQRTAETIRKLAIYFYGPKQGEQRAFFCVFCLDKPIYLPFPGHQIFKLRAASINSRKKNKGRESWRISAATVSQAGTKGVVTRYSLFAIRHSLCKCSVQLGLAYSGYSHRLSPRPVWFSHANPNANAKRKLRKDGHLTHTKCPWNNKLAIMPSWMGMWVGLGLGLGLDDVECM